MPAPPSTQNYKVGGIRVRLGTLDLGNVVSFSMDSSNIETLDHFSARSGTRKLDKQVVTQKRLTFTVELDEHARELYQYLVMGNLSGTNEVHAMTNPLPESSVYIEYVEESGPIWTFSHSKAVVRPSGEADFGEFDDWVSYELEIEVLEDPAQAPATMGRFIFAQ